MAGEDTKKIVEEAAKAAAREAVKETLKDLQKEDKPKIELAIHRGKYGRRASQHYRDPSPAEIHKWIEDEKERRKQPPPTPTHEEVRAWIRGRRRYRGAETSQKISDGQGLSFRSASSRAARRLRRGLETAGVDLADLVTDFTSVLTELLRTPARRSRRISPYND